MDEMKETVAEQLRRLQMLMHRAAFHEFAGDGRRYDPRRGQGRVLAILKMKPEISQKELTYLLDMSRQSLAELLAKLERSGYVTREPSEEGGRAMTVKLTEEGARAAGEADDDAPEAARVLDCLSDEELAAFSDYLGRVIGRYEEQFPDEDFDERRKLRAEFISRYGRGHGRGPEWPGWPGRDWHHHEGRHEHFGEHHECHDGHHDERHERRGDRQGGAEQ